MFFFVLVLVGSVCECLFVFVSVAGRLNVLFGAFFQIAAVVFLSFVADDATRNCLLFTGSCTHSLTHSDLLTRSKYNYHRD